MNVTDGIAFPWKRFLRNTVPNKEIMAGGISAVYAVHKPHDSEGPQLFFCHPNSSYTRVIFRDAKTQVVHSSAGKWEDLPDLQNAAYCDTSWMIIRGNAEQSRERFPGDQERSPGDQERSSGESTGGRQRSATG